MEKALLKKEQRRRVSEPRWKGQNGSFTPTPGPKAEFSVRHAEGTLGVKVLFLGDGIGWHMKLVEMEQLPKPKSRGLIHLIMSPISLVAGLVLITAAERLQGRITLGIFTLTAVTLFTCSALYHRVKWRDKYRALWRRIDHANITILIAGTYTPFSIYLLSRQSAVVLLSCVWGGAILTALIRILWLNAPRWIYVPLYIALGWAAVFFLPAFWQKGGVLVFLLILFGGIFYTAGGVIYAIKKPNFSINWFGFHELFHALTAAAFLCHFVAAVFVVYTNK